MMSQSSDLTPIIRGAQRRCPACGQGKLFQGYLKLNPECVACGEHYSHDMAADGPAWLTVLLLGPFFAPLIFIISMTFSDYFWIAFPLLGAFMIGTALSLLAVMKGAWIGALWRMKRNRKNET